MLQEIELKIKDEDEDGVFAISLVESPAIEENFVALSSQEIELKVINEEKRIVVGFALVPEKRIYRRQNGKEFNIYFTKETVAQAAELYMKKLNLNNFTLEHESKTSGVSVIESWVVEDTKHDKANLYNLNPKGGEWVVMSKIYNDDVWNDVKEGKFKGYSIEAMFSGFEQLASKEESEAEETLRKLKELLSEK